jgi:hypothetical protein
MNKLFPCITIIPQNLQGNIMVGTADAKPPAAQVPYIK